MVLEAAGRSTLARSLEKRQLADNQNGQRLPDCPPEA
jgi:hypothetical protein